MPVSRLAARVSPPWEPTISALLLLTGELSAEPSEPWRADPYPEPEGAASEPRRILVAEDDPMVSAMVERLLAEEGYEVRSARHGEEALRVALRGAVDLLVTDIRMPVMDGWELSRRLRERWPELPVLYISGYDVELRHGLQDLRAGAFLRKPFDPDELVRQVGRLLER